MFLIFDKFRPDFGKMKANLLTTCLFGCILQLSMVSVGKYCFRFAIFFVIPALNLSGFDIETQVKLVR